MARKIEGGIIENQDLARFTASHGNVTPKNSIDLMARNWFSLKPGRTTPIEHEYLDAKSGLTETVRITGSSELGIATIYDQDLLFFAISQWIEAKRLGLEPSRRIHFTPYQFFSWIDIEPCSSSYARIKDALDRLKMTNIETTVRSEAAKRNRRRRFSWVSEWEITEQSGQVLGVEIVLAEWLFESIRNYHVLTLDKRYFDIPGSFERWLYLYARKATGGRNGTWKESFHSLHQKSASQQDYKHFASTLRKLIEKDNLPGLQLKQVSSVHGKPLLQMERTEKRAIHTEETKDAIAQDASLQLALIERSPLEEAWENVLELMRKQLGEAEVKSWLEKLQLVGLEQETVLYRAPTKFMADWIETHYKLKLEQSWQASGHPVKKIKVETKPKKPS